MSRVRAVLPAGAVPSWHDLRSELGIREEFPEDVLAEARASAAAPTLPDLDLTAVPFWTLDPPGSRDLDQALHIERAQAGFQVRYAIADVAAFVKPGGALDAEVRRRGETLYAPDVRVPLHPPVLSEDAASLLAGAVRPALVWTLELNADGELRTTQVRRARIRSADQRDYPTVQRALDAGAAGEQPELLREVGGLRQRLARTRGAVDLPSLEQVVQDEPAGPPRLTFRAPEPVEGWNAQISLLTGIAAARLMLDGGVGLLRTLAPPDASSVQSLRRSALALGIEWPAEADWGTVISGLDPATPAAAALLALAPRLLRGAGYVAFDGAPPEQAQHSAVAAPYAHCTAPLRRLADRYVGEVCLALCAGTPVPSWARAALAEMPEVMAAADHTAHALERATIDLAEAVVLAPRVGEEFDAVVVETGERGGVVQLCEPAVRAKCEGASLPLGEQIRVRLELADPAARAVRFRRS